MTARVVLSCDGTWDGGRMPCRGAYPARTEIPQLAHAEAIAAGWSLDVDGDLCPAHGRRQAEQQTATDREAL